MTESGDIMSCIEEFAVWMRENTQLAESSVYKYSRAVNTISDEMHDKGIITCSLFSMSLLQLDTSITLILNCADFIEKNRTGNHMYSNALKQYRLFRNVEFESDIDGRETTQFINGFAHMGETERIALVKSRIGQGIFRKSLLNKYNNRCVITGINEKKLLIASHIKPWAVCTNEERLSVENGLLLSPTFDKLFDCGLISFTDEGKIIISSQISYDVIRRLHISEDDVFNLQMSNELKSNLEYHRDVVFTTAGKRKAV